MQTFILIELLGKNRVLRIMSDELPAGMPLTQGSALLFEGRAWGITNRFAWVEAPLADSDAGYSPAGSRKLWEMTKLLTGSPEAAAAVLESLEDIGSGMYSVTVNYDPSGNPVSCTVNGTGGLTDVTFVQASGWATPPSLRETGANLVASPQASVVDTVPATSDDDGPTCRK